jgi:hypothetical protein
MSHQDFGHYGSKPFPMVVSPNHGTNHQHNVAATLSPPPAPPRPQAYNWDLLYPFNMNYEVPNYDHRDNYDIRDEDVRKIREREGIPDLEDESELNSNVSRLNVKRDSFPSNEDEIKCDLEPKITTPVSSSTMSIKEAVLDIKNDCKHIYDCGREFSLVIETGKIPYHSVSTKLRGKVNLLFFFACELIDKSKNVHDHDLLYFRAAFSACVLVRIVPSVPSCLHPSYMPQQPAPRTKKLSKAKMQNNQDHTKIGDLSSTLEQLYVWEKKLYEEVLVNNYLYFFIIYRYDLFLIVVKLVVEIVFLLYFLNNFNDRVKKNSEFLMISCTKG